VVLWCGRRDCFRTLTPERTSLDRDRARVDAWRVQEAQDGLRQPGSEREDSWVVSATRLGLAREDFDGHFVATLDAQAILQ
jgi:hypothetical protein